MVFSRPLCLLVALQACVSTTDGKVDGGVDTEDTDVTQVAPCEVPGAICTVAGEGGKLGLNGDGLPPLETWLYFPSGLDWAPDGALVIDDFNNMRIRALRDGRLTTIVGDGVHGWATPEAPALESALENPVDVAYGPDGVLYVAELHTSRILSVGDDGLIHVFAGTGDEGFSGDGAPAVQALLFSASGVAVASDGRVFIADTNNHCVRVVGLDGEIQRLGGDGVPGTDVGMSGRLHHPQRLALDGDRLLVADAGNHQVRAIDLVTHEVTVVAGDGTEGGGGDGGPATKAQLMEPYGVTVGADGTVYIADFADNRVRAIAPDGTISTLAGTGVAEFSGDGGPATDASLNGPADVLVGPDGALYIADMINGVVRRVAPHD